MESLDAHFAAQKWAKTEIWPFLAALLSLFNGLPWSDPEGRAIIDVMSVLYPPKIDEEFSRHLTAEDELGVIIRAHIHVEASLNEIVVALVPFPDDLPRLNYEPKLKLACALGLKQDRFQPLKRLGDLRNSFGHRLDATLSDSKVNELYGALCTEDKDLIAAAYKMTNDQRGDSNPPAFDTLPAKDRFVLIAVMLKAFLVAAAHEAREKKSRS